MIETIAYLREQLAAIYDPEETRATHSSEKSSE